MGRPLRTTAGGLAYHVLNRANARMQIFDTEKDYDAFEGILDEAVRRVKMRLLAYCVMPNHWHLVVWPREDGDLSTFVGWLTLTHTQRWHAHRHSVGSGHVYQGRFKSFLVESDEHLWTVCRYVERNALRAGLCVRAEEWRWSSVWRRGYGDAECRAALCAVADRHAAGLAPACQPGRESTRVGGVAPLREPKSTFWERGVGGFDDEALRSGLSLPPPRPSVQGIPKQRFLTPFCPLAWPVGHAPRQFGHLRDKACPLAPIMITSYLSISLAPQAGTSVLYLPTNSRSSKSGPIPYAGKQVCGGRECPPSWPTPPAAPAQAATRNAAAARPR